MVGPYDCQRGQTRANQDAPPVRPIDQDGNDASAAINGGSGLLREGCKNNVDVMLATGG